MTDELNSCRICGEFVLQIPGWSYYVPSYTLLRAEWRSDAPFFEGALHFSCLSGWEHREAFLAEIRTIMTGYGKSLMFEAGGETHTPHQPGFHFGDPIYRGEGCEIFRHTATDSWLVLTRRGPWFRLEREQLATLAEHGTARAAGGGERTELPEGPALAAEEVSGMGLAELLDLLGSADRYPGLSEGAPEYTVWSFHERKRVLEYSVAVDLPLPAPARTFLASYAREYQPIVLDDEPDSAEGSGGDAGRKPGGRDPGGAPPAPRG
ncbi:hypothetical protein [Streptomyces triticirhizae]|uniref:hypothetical protein n=1 Tax=Streptomyces triticirhizae TaxID=2483353 RepID=UPI0011C42AAC|nr:hypothetical protein [Streptomyces triticirhizae]